jgi:hypothetical protein
MITLWTPQEVAERGFLESGGVVPEYVVEVEHRAEPRLAEVEDLRGPGGRTA